MQIVLIFITILLFPLNSLLLIQGTLVQGGENKSISINIDSNGGEVKGMDSIRQDGASKQKAAPLPSMIPNRKSGIGDLAISNAHASLVLDVDSGTILHYNNGRQQRQIASLTKLMTAVLVMENIKNLDETVTIDEEAVYAEGTRIGCPRSGYCISQRLKVGEKISARNLLTAMLMNSANDAAIALGKHIGGTQERFADIMNAKAKQLGLEDTHFCTPSGLEPEGRESECYSSAYDIARIAAYSTRYDLVWQIFRKPNNTEISSVDGSITHTILNTDLILDQVPNCLGGKTGFTPLAGHSLLMGVMDQQKKHKIIAVVLDDPYRWQDIKTMINWTFSSYDWK